MSFDDCKLAAHSKQILSYVRFNTSEFTIVVKHRLTKEAVQKFRNADFGHFEPLPSYVTKRNVSFLPPSLRHVTNLVVIPPPRSNFSLTHAMILYMRKIMTAHTHTYRRGH